ncbi:hypothetical protein BH20ACI2_BH20ACI2_04350 [soil metagenome]
MASMSQRQYRPSQENRLTKIIVLKNLRARLLVSFTFLLLSCLLHTSVLTVSLGAASTSPSLATRTYKVVTIGPGCGGFFGHIRIDLESEGNEVSGYYSLQFDPAVLTNPIVTLGADTAGTWTLLTNPNQLAQGRIGIAADTVPGNPATLSPPDRRMINIRFDVVPGSPTGPTSITFVPNNAVPTPPTLRSTSDPDGNLLPTVYQDGSLMIGGTACTTSARVSLSGRVTNATGLGIRSAEVFLTDSEGNRRKVLTSSLGYYQFDEIDSGKSYVMGVSSRRYRFESRVVQVTDNLTELDFVGLE